MKIFIIGISGGVGSLLADELRGRGDAVRGLVRQPDQRAVLELRGIQAQVGDLESLSADDLAVVFGDADAIVFSAGSNGGSRAASKAIDGDGVKKAIDAAQIAGIERFTLVSVLPESWRERDLGDDVEYYFAVKKAADVALSRSGLNWLILRPSLLVDEPGIGTVSLGPAELHDQIAREDVARTLAQLLHTPGIGRQILELNAGSMPIAAAVRANTR
ncbi:NAD-dependent epimerase/dehydratase family protein [Cryobacterium lactosi]|uniref:NAD-dependent epimerase/dehydratase family protein n=1 Tax=Cryobacterium lactosi TaxID=1259202 RepID=A0A4R9BX61_9MICO|nr:NAD(P)H-binding protein [Cryobacterium lactosi]TFD92093.1 NAD-dependent epimerase/dehydratase family protein [Cryobacterium lactosi]